MIKSIGTDLVLINRIAEIGADRFSKKILNDSEHLEYDLITNEKRKHTYLAGRFAAKEALFKCFKTGDKTANFKDFSILNDENGAPYVVSKHIDNLQCFITITHTDEHAIAFVVLEYID